MWFLLYNLLLVVASPLILLVLLSKTRCRRGLGQRMGMPPESCGAGGSEQPGWGQPVLWIHAVSLGEVAAVVPMIQELHQRCPGYRMVVSTVTETGREAVEQRLAGIAEHCYAPLDFPWVVTRIIGRIRPAAFILVETELWPNLLRALARQHIPIVLINGRLSTRSFHGYGLIKSFMREVLANVTWCLMQSERDAERVVTLGAPKGRVLKTGNLKCDQPMRNGKTLATSLTRETIGLDSEEELIVAGSTHPGEEQQILDCYVQLQREFPSLVLVIAPRHIERTEELERAVRVLGVVAIRRSQVDVTRQASSLLPRPRVIILDTRGELPNAYELAVVAYVGGTLVPVGGHNLLEPALSGKPVFYGPYTDHCEEIAELLVKAGGGVQVSNEDELRAEMAGLFRNRVNLRAAGEAARRAIQQNQGALGRTLDVIEGVLKDHDERGTVNKECRGADRGNRKWFSVMIVPRALCRIHRSALRMLMFPYELLVKIRALLYARGWLRRRKLPCPVVSVGNLTVGGTGKTPMVIWLTEWLMGRGKRVGVLSRGYGRQSPKDVLLVSDGTSVLLGPDKAGDEPYLIARRCPGAVVAVGADRYNVGLAVLEQFPIDCFVLDDGFQHLALDRDVNLLLVDVSDLKGLDSLFPVGRLREPLSAASRATSVVMTRVEGDRDWKDDLLPVLTACGSEKKPILARFVVGELVEVATGNTTDASLVKDKACFAFSGVANPKSFRSLLLKQGCKIVGERIFPDHHRYSAMDMKGVVRLAQEGGAGLILTTEKDAGKVAPFCPKGVEMYAVRLRTEILEGEEAFEQLILDHQGLKQVGACA